MAVCRDSVAFTCVNSGTSFLAGFIVFTILGYMAKLQNRPVSEVAESGQHAWLICSQNIL